MENKDRDKHKLQHDPVFGRKKIEYEEIEIENDSLEIESGSAFYDEVHDQERAHGDLVLAQLIYDLLEITDVSMEGHRRKPSREAFNKMFVMLITNLYPQGYSATAIFVELSYYFSDKLLSMFKLLDKKNSSLVIKEMKNQSLYKSLINDMEILKDPESVAGEIITLEDIEFF